MHIWLGSCVMIMLAYDYRWIKGPGQMSGTRHDPLRNDLSMARPIASVMFGKPPRPIVLV